MAHLKVKPFDTTIIDDLCKSDSIFLFRAAEPKGYREMLSVDSGKSRFLLDIFKRERDYLIKCESSTRPLDIEEIKKVMKHLQESAGLEVINSNITLSDRKPPIPSEYEKSIEDFEDFFSPFERVAVEVGFGSGRHLLYQAEKERDRLHIGIEIHTPSAQQLLKQIQLRGLDNIWVVNYDARLLMEMLPSNSCEAIFVHFPVPWDKKPHRRVISVPFVKESLRTLEKGGILELRTDSENYYRYALEVFSAFDKISFRVEKNSDIDVVSKYEARWKNQNKNIYNLSVECDTFDEDIEKDYDFSFKKAVKCSEIYDIPEKALLFDGYFVHFGKRFVRSDGRGCLIECSFGSFDRPERKFIAVEDDKMRYIPFAPAANKTTHKADKKIREILNV